MKVLVIGSGGREHALAWKVAESRAVETVFVAPGNPGTAREQKVKNLAIAEDDFEGIAGFAEREGVELTIVGPEAPLVAGIRDFFDARNLKCFGPSKAAAQLEGSKAFTKAFMARHGIPTAGWAEFTDADDAEQHIRTGAARQHNEPAVPIVVKADGLAAGKGVVLAEDADSAVAAARDMLSGTAFGDAGRRIVVEQFLRGEEASFICLCDGKTALPLASSQDHKARDDGDRGPNTGGMGAYSPAPVVTDAVHDRIMAEVIRPTLAGMAAEGAPYQGFLYAGLMVLPDGGIRVVEFNCRMGDPEAEPLLTRLRSDLPALCLAALDGRLDEASVNWDTRTALCVALVAGGYPLAYDRGDPISGLDEDLADTRIFHAGTAETDGQIVTAGGRVLYAVGVGDDVREAQRRAYERAATVRFRAMAYRKDIGFRAIDRANA